jgi:hypothetical protein
VNRVGEHQKSRCIATAGGTAPRWLGRCWWTSCTRPSSSCRVPQMRRSATPPCCRLPPHPAPKTPWDSSVSLRRSQEPRLRNTPLSLNLCEQPLKQACSIPSLLASPPNAMNSSPAIVAIVVGAKGDPDWTTSTRSTTCSSRRRRSRWRRWSRSMTSSRWKHCSRRWPTSSEPYGRA